MEHRLGHIGLVAWQGRREQPRPSGAAVGLATTAGLCALLLLLRFTAGLPLPLEILQIAFAGLVGSCALLLTRALVGLAMRGQRR